MQPRVKRLQVGIRKNVTESRVEPLQNASIIADEPFSPAEALKLQRNGIPQIIQDFRHPSLPKSLFRATVTFRKLLASHAQDSTFVDQLIQMGLFQDLNNMLDHEESPRLQFEAVWGITNAFALRPLYFSQCDAVFKIFRILTTSPHAGLKEQCLWSLGNMFSRGQPWLFRSSLDMVMAALVQLFLHSYALSDQTYIDQSAPSPHTDPLNGIPGLLLVLPSRWNALRQATWAISNCLRFHISGGFDSTIILPLLPCLKDLILSSTHHPEVVLNSLWIFADVSQVHAPQILRLGICDTVLEFALHANVSVAAACSQIVCNLARSHAMSVYTLFLRKRADLVLISHLSSERIELHPCASWTLAFAASTVPQFRLESDNVELIWRLLESARSKSEVRQDCAVVLCFHSTTSDVSRVLDVLMSGILFDVDLLLSVLSLLSVFLQMPGQRHIFESKGGFSKLHHISAGTVQESVQNAVEELLIRFEGEENAANDINDDDDETIAFHPGQREILSSTNNRSSFEHFSKECM